MADEHRSADEQHPLEDLPTVESALGNVTGGAVANGGTSPLVPSLVPGRSRRGAVDVVDYISSSATET